jgi:NitT/TauT family transport system substrate-binding protein
LRLQGIDPTVLLNYDLGLPQQGDPIFVTGETLSAKQDALVRFMRATMRGWAYATANPDDTVDTIISKFGEDLDRPQQIEALKAFAVLVNTDYSQQHGLLAINPPTWTSSAQVMLDQGKLDAPFDVESLLAPSVQEQARK